MSMTRLDKILTDTGRCSRSKAKELIRAGSVRVNGAVVTDAAAKFDPEAVIVSVAGEQLEAPGHLYVMLNKPDGLLSASTDRNKPTVLDLMPPEWRKRGLFCVGRLDKDTTGLLLLTDDGEYAHKVISPKSCITKLYEAQVEGTAGEKDVQAFRDGLTLRDGLHCLPAELIPLSPGRVQVEVMEGKYHQVKRMLASRELPVLQLRRLRIGSLWLDPDLGSGEYRILTEEEIALALTPLCRNDEH